MSHGEHAAPFAGLDPFEEAGSLLVLPFLVQHLCEGVPVVVPVLYTRHLRPFSLLYLTRSEVRARPALTARRFLLPSGA